VKERGEGRVWQGGGERRRGASSTDDNAARREPSARDAAPPIRATSKLDL
jgi:hypothetical protein